MKAQDKKAKVSKEVAHQEYGRAVRQRDLIGSGGRGRLTSFEIVAPLDGVVADTNLTVGEQVDVSRRLFFVFDPAVVWVEAKVYEADIGHVEQLTEAKVSVEAYPGEYFTGTLFAVAPQVDPTTRTVKVIFEVPNDSGRLRPGMFAHILISTGEAHEAMAVDEAAVVRHEGRDVVFVKLGPEQFTARDVSLGSRDAGYRVVRAGLAVGERVVTRGVHQVRSASGR